MPSLQTQASAPPNPSAPGTNEWKYNEIMRLINPDLLTTVIPTHGEKYANETLEERTARVKKYDEDFAIFDNVCKVISAHEADDLRLIKQAAHDEAMKRETAEHAEEEHAAEKKIDDSFQRS